MKCPKCQYISFDQGSRCRNCGYEFSLSEPAELDLPIKTGDEAVGPFADFDLGASGETPAPHAAPAAEGARTPELPLFRDRMPDDDAPLVSLPATPRAPVSVRKSALPRAAHRPAHDEPVLDLEPPVPVSSRPASRPAADVDRAERQHAAGGETSALGARALAGGVDLLLLGVIDAAILYFTLQLCGLDLAEIRLLPIVPFAAFVALLNGGYIAAFTSAGGQTIGKMLAGIKVVSTDESAWSDRVPLGQAVVRAVGYLLSVGTAGLGFLPILLAADRRGFHDRLAHTRVVRA